MITQFLLLVCRIVILNLSASSYIPGTLHVLAMFYVRARLIGHIYANYCLEFSEIASIVAPIATLLMSIQK